MSRKTSHKYEKFLSVGENPPLWHSQTDGRHNKSWRILRCYIDVFKLIYTDNEPNKDHVIIQKSVGYVRKLRVFQEFFLNFPAWSVGHTYKNGLVHCRLANQSLPPTPAIRKRSRTQVVLRVISPWHIRHGRGKSFRFAVLSGRPPAGRRRIKNAICFVLFFILGF